MKKIPDEVEDYYMDQRDYAEVEAEDEEELSECCSARLENERCMDCKEFSWPYIE